MQSKPTPKQVDVEIGKLRAMKPSVRQFSMFDDDNHQAIDAQLRVMSENMDEEKLYAEFSDCQHTLDAALAARQWMDGTECTAPSDDWKPLVTK